MMRFRQMYPLIGGVLALLVGTDVQAATVRVRILEGESDRITPAMVCITGSDGRVRLPPDGRILVVPSLPQDVHADVDFQSDLNWIGPVRQMRDGDGFPPRFITAYQTRRSIPYWREPAMYLSSGNFTVELSPGRWRIAVDRGVEHVPVNEEIVVSGDSPQVKTIRMHRWIDAPAHGWWSGDVHVHYPLLEEKHGEFLLQYARAADVHIVNVLEFGTREGVRNSRQAGFGSDFRVRRGNYCLVSGQEDPRTGWGHVLALNISAYEQDLEAYFNYDVVFDRFSAQPGALVGAAHFANRGFFKGFPLYVTTGGYDFIELLQFAHINTAYYYDFLNLGFRLSAAAGSDAPGGSTIGEVRTFVHTGPTLDVDAWFEQLERGRTFVTNGPFLEFTVDDKLPGTELNLASGDMVTIRARVLSHL